MGKTLRKLLVAGAFVLALTGDCSGSKVYASRHREQTHFESLNPGYKVTPFAMIGGAVVAVVYYQYRKSKKSGEHADF